MATGKTAKKTKVRKETPADAKAAFANLRAELDGAINGALEKGDVKSRSSDIVGYWVPEESPCVCIPQFAKVFDGKTFDKTKPSTLIFAELVKPCVVATTDEDGEQVIRVAEPGDLVGVWYKPGMRTIAHCAGMVTALRLNGKSRDVGKGEPMKLYDVITKGQGTKQLKIIEDFRDKSVGAPLPFPSVAGAGGAAADPEDDGRVAGGGDDDIPF